MNQTELRDALARHPAAVVVVSTVTDEGFRGLTATSFASVSLTPPLVLVCLDRLSAVRDAVAAAGGFNLSLLARSQEFFADRFAGRAPAVDPGWREIPHRLGSNGIPVLEGCAAWFECALELLHPAGDHEIALARVTSAGSGEAEPLVYWDRAFWRLSG